jgi:periplasmic protein TonB
MTAARVPSTVRSWPDALRWGTCFALALSFHAAGAAALLARWSEDSDLVANAPVIMVDLAPLPVAPEVTPNELPPDTVLSKQAEPEPEPEKPLSKVELQPEPKAVVTLPAEKLKPVEKPKEKNKPKQKQASVTSAPSTAENRAERTAAPMPGASSRNPDALRNWQSRLVAQIERHKRFDGSDRGLVRVAFSVDRSGGVHHARVVASSGSAVLDRDALAWLARSQPLPPPPPDISGAMIPITVPLRYNYR